MHHDVHVPLERQPERLALQALIPTWRAGLRIVITIPCAGDDTRVASPQALLMTAGTRWDAPAYGAALDRFTDSARL